MNRIAVVANGGSDLGVAVARRIADRMDVLVVPGIDGAMPDGVGTDGSPERNRVIVTDASCSPSATNDLEAILTTGDYCVHTLVNLIAAPKAAPDVTDWASIEYVDQELCRAFRFVREVAADMLMRRQGVVINVAPPRPAPGSSCAIAYESVLGGIDGMTRSLSLELGARGIRVNAVIPGVLADAGASGAEPPPRRGRSKPASVLGRAGSADEVADVIDFLATDRASFVNGVSLRVDGGGHF